MFYFSTNTSSQKVEVFRGNPKAGVYFYKQGRQKYVGIHLKGTMEVLTDHDAKASIWLPRRTRCIIHWASMIPDYCVLKFTVTGGRFYSEGKTEDFQLTDTGQ